MSNTDPPAAHANAVESSDPVRDELDRKARQRVAEVLAQVSSLRNLPALGPVNARVIDRDTMLRQVRERVRSQVPPEAIRGESEFLKAFGFIPEQFDYEAGVYRLIQSELAGYYDPDAKHMFLMDDLSSSDAETTLAHELVHALQDQHYDLGPKLGFEPDANDHQSAIQSLAEGDATSAMLDYILAPGGQNALDIPEERLRAQLLAGTAMSPELASFPHVLRASLLAPYVDGVLFVRKLRSRGGWKAVDDVWQNLPQTSEQMLHLDKLDAREPAETIAIPTIAALGEHWRPVHTDVYGEQGFRIALEDWMPARPATAAARGWAGDHAVVARRTDQQGGDVAAAWHIRFDRAPAPRRSDAEAVEAFDSIVSAWEGRPSPGTACKALPSGRILAIARRGRDIAVIAGPPNQLSAGGRNAGSCDFEKRWAADVLAQP